MPPLPPSPQSASLQNLFKDSPECRVLDNGLNLVFQESHDHPLISTQVWVRTGSIHESPRLGSGLSHFLEHMLFKGTEKRGPSAIAHDVQANGSQINAYTTFDRTVYHIDGPSEALADSLEILHDLTLHSTLPGEEVLKEREVILREIDMTLDDPDRIVSRALFSTAYRDHPNRYPVIGLRPLFTLVDRDALWDYYRRRYHPGNMILVVAGDFDREALIDQVNQTFGSDPPVCPDSLTIQPEVRQLALREQRLYGDYQTSRGLLAFKIPDLRHPDAPALDLLATLLGAGYSGRLRQELREEKGLVHSVSASAWNPRDPGLFFIQYHADADKAGDAESAIREHLSKLASHPFSAEELEKARRFALVSEVQSRMSVSSLASRIGQVACQVGDLQYPERYFQQIGSLQASELTAVAGRWFTEDRLTIASLAPEAKRPSSSRRRTRRELPPFEEVRLANGARLYWQKDSRLPRVWMRYTGRGGPAFEDSEYRGATSLLSTLMTRDTLVKAASDVVRDLESQGGFITESSGNNTFAISVDVPSELIGSGIDAVRDAVCIPAFKEETVKREIAAQLAHIREIEDDIVDYGRLALRRKFFEGHPFASSSFGSLDSTARVDVAYLKGLYNRLVVSRNAVLVVSGDFDPDDLLPRCQSFLSQLPDRPFSRDTVPFHPPGGPLDFKEKMDREQAVLFEAYPDPGFVSGLDITAEVLDEILSDMSGPLFQSVREEQSLAYFVGASRILGDTFGAFLLYAGTHPSATNQVFQSFDAELQRIRDGLITEKELGDARTRLKVHDRSTLQRPASRAARVAVNALFNKPVMDWLDYEARLDALSVDDLTRFAREQLHPSKRLRLTVSPQI